MIKKQEIMNFAWEFSLLPNTVEKDYVLGWLLAGIAHHSDLFDKWIFKGGTCLKKCYFETYRLPLQRCNAPVRIKLDLTAFTPSSLSPASSWKT